MSGQAITIAVLALLGMTGCTIAAVSIFAGGMSDSASERAKAQQSGFAIGAVSLALLAIAFLLRLS